MPREDLGAVTEIVKEKVKRWLVRTQPSHRI